MCPHFVSSGRNVFYCDSLIKNEATIESFRMSFASPRKCKNWQEQYCQASFEVCPLHSPQKVQEEIKPCSSDPATLAVRWV